MQFVVSNKSDLNELAGRLSHELKVGDTILLNGNLGSGKTEFVRFVAEHLGVRGEITSPTYCFLNSYVTNAGFKLHHFDLCRLASEDELSDVGFDECGYEPRDGVSFIEWADRFPDSMPDDALKLTFTGQGDEPRLIDIEAESTRSKALAESIKDD